MLVFKQHRLLMMDPHGAPRFAPHDNPAAGQLRLTDASQTQGGHYPAYLTRAITKNKTTHTKQKGTKNQARRPAPDGLGIQTQLTLMSGLEYS